MMYKRILFVLVLTLLAVTACSSEPVAVVEAIPTSTPEPTEIPKLMPGDPPEPERILEDADSSLRWYEKRAVSGDNMLNNLFERPFTSVEMDYQPYLNILNAAIANDELFYYFTIVVDGDEEAPMPLSGTYGVEFDRSQTGRGDLLVWASSLQEEWSTDGVVVYVDQQKKVGGYQPILAEEGFKGDGYKEILQMEGDKVAWARLSPGDPFSLQIAVSKALLEYATEFLWGAWADAGVKDPFMFDYNDHFTLAEAGSPINTDTEYPVKDLYSMDNTCRLPYGLEQVGNTPGMCISMPAGESRNCFPCRCPGVFTHVCWTVCCD